VSAVLASIVAAAVVGSVHCTSMCGGLVAFGTAGAGPGLASRATALGAYNAARGLGYASLGVVAGALGSTLDHAGLRIGISRTAGAVAAVVMLAWGAARLFDAAKLLSRLRIRAPKIDVPVTRLVRSVAARPPLVRSAVVGGCTALLPCGFLHAFLVVAAGTGSAFGGGSVMVAFWLGTLPAVVGLGIGVSTVLAPLRRHASLVGGLVLVFFGLSNLFERWSPPFVSAIHTTLFGS
jgi:sulfite exporter TauE/SafE